MRVLISSLRHWTQRESVHRTKRGGGSSVSKTREPFFGDSGVDVRFGGWNAPSVYVAVTDWIGFRRTKTIPQKTPSEDSRIAAPPPGNSSVVRTRDGLADVSLRRTENSQQSETPPPPSAGFEFSLRSIRRVLRNTTAAARRRDINNSLWRLNDVRRRRRTVETGKYAVSGRSFQTSSFLCDVISAYIRLT